MPLTPDQLPDDIAELKRLLLATDTELTAAKNGLIHCQLTIETLKAQLAKLRREKFGQSSERIERVLEQLELALEEAEAGQAESTAPAEATSPSTDQTVSPSAPASERPEQKQKKRRTLPPHLPRRDVVHAPADVCKTCGGTDLRKVGESVTEILAYIPGKTRTAFGRPAGR
jgi:transposase